VSAHLQGAQRSRLHLRGDGLADSQTAVATLFFSIYSKTKSISNPAKLKIKAIY
jgi:hypothetical protein